MSIPHRRNNNNNSNYCSNHNNSWHSLNNSRLLVP